MLGGLDKREERLLLILSFPPFALCTMQGVPGILPIDLDTCEEMRAINALNPPY
jgi:hypothetical protein